MQALSPATKKGRAFTLRNMRHWFIKNNCLDLILIPLLTLIIIIGVSVSRVLADETERVPIPVEREMIEILENQ